MPWYTPQRVGPIICPFSRLLRMRYFSVVANMTCPYGPKFRQYGPTLCQLVSKTHAEVAIDSGCFGAGGLGLTHLLWFPWWSSHLSFRSTRFKIESQLKICFFCSESKCLTLLSLKLPDMAPWLLLSRMRSVLTLEMNAIEEEILWEG